MFQWRAYGGTTAHNSSLISTYDYTETFTINGTSRVDYSVPDSSGLYIESTYGNSPVTWTPNVWRFVTNTSAAQNTNYPGDSGSGSSTGAIQCSATGGRWGIDYLANGNPLHTDYVVQVDAVLTSGRIEITSKASANALFSDASSLSVFFKPEGISIYRNVSGLGETSLLTFSTALPADSWQNFAVKFSPTTLNIYLNQILQLSVNLADVGTSHLDYTGYSQNAVGFGFQSPSESTEWGWFDNFQVGSAVPEPQVNLLLCLSLFVRYIHSANRRRPKTLSSK